jgi:translation initiation factor IF-2|tara:strand:- start:66 stop:299 length:234 start_codon:yes stop_codon:yes gene_type:complete
MSEDTTVEAEVAATPETSEAQGPDLTVQDLQALKSIIDVASQRGAFKPNEMMTVGQTYGKLETFLAAVAQQQPAQGA